MSGSRVISCQQSEAAVIKSLCQWIEEAAANSIKDKGTFFIGVSGGSVAKFLSAGLPSIQTDWTKWTVLFCDERHVPFSDGDNTFKVYKENFIGKVPLTEEQFILNDASIKVDDAALEYERKMRRVLNEDSSGFPIIDVLVLGIGPDGHTCSLFPGHPLLSETQKWVSSISDSPKPPSERITLTFPVINNASHCIFALVGKGKSEMVKRILKDKEELPAAMVQPKQGKLVWILDEDAASDVKDLLSS